MGHFYVDDRFPEHPKAIAAGEEASYLFICGLAYVRRNTVTTIPKALAHRLVTKNGARLARRLCEVNLWHDRGDHYEIHDYKTRNAKQLAKSEQAKQAADIRWKKYAAEQQSSSADAMRTHMQTQSECSADAMPVRARVRESKYPSIQVSSSSSSRHPHRPPPDSRPEDEELAQNGTITDKAMHVLALRALAATPSRVGNPHAWLQKTAGQRLEHHQQALAALDLAAFAAPQQLADHLEPPATKPATPSDQRAAADRANETRADQPECPECGRHGCGGWVYPNGPDGGTIQCPRWRKRLRVVS